MTRGGAAIRSAREYARISQQSLAERIGRSVRWVSQLECGLVDPRVTDLEQIADVCRVSRRELMVAFVRPRSAA